MRLNWHPPKPEYTKAHYTWSADHAAQVHEGGIRADGSRMPARPFVDVTVEETDIAGAFVENFQNTKDLGEAFADTAYYLAGQFEQAIQDERWEWDRPTVRSDGSVVGSPRDIVDTGELLRSQSLELE